MQHISAGTVSNHLYITQTSSIKGSSEEAFKQRGMNRPAMGRFSSIPIHKTTYSHTKVSSFHLFAGF
jgi:hypothetical protein